MTIQWCGTGLSAVPGLKRLIGLGYPVCVWNRTVEKAQQVVGSYTTRIRQFDLESLRASLAEGDIGQHFPPSDPQWKGAASEIFLRHAVQLATDKGFGIGNVDCTIICEFPKIGPHAAAMQNHMAHLMGCRPDQVSVKATTSERLGFTGRGEGIACIATCTLVAL